MPADRERNTPLPKRAGSENSNVAPDAKRIKNSHGERPETNADAQSSARSLQRIPFHDKVCPSV